MRNENQVKTNTLYYIHDPMCSWCYAFKPVLYELQQRLNSQYTKRLNFETLLGGLATDTDAPMPTEMRQQLRATWQGIEQKVVNTQFNYRFWDDWQNTRPRRSTYPACRAVIAAHSFDESPQDYYEKLMNNAIQQAYYQQALNPSDNSVLIALALQIGLPEQAFKKQLFASHTQKILEQQINFSQQINVQSYPSLVLKIESSYWPISINYLNCDAMLETIDLLLDFEN